MADPFEVRMRFTDQLRQLNASVTSAQKAARYALKYHDMAEDLHSCILEQLERNSMNTRANIMYFIEHFLDLAHKETYGDYVEMMQRDIIRVVDAVAPDDGSGAANIKVVRKVLRALQSKDFLETEAVTQIEEVLRERETASQDLGVLASPSNDPPTEAGSASAGAAAAAAAAAATAAIATADGPDAVMPELGDTPVVSGSDAIILDLGDMPPSQTLPPPAAAAASSSSFQSRGGLNKNGSSGHRGGQHQQQRNHHHHQNPAAPRLDRKQIEQRMEEDRERHKRQREGDWEVPSGQYAELEKLWEETSELGDDDDVMMAEEWQEWQACRDASLRNCPHRTGINGAAIGSGSGFGGDSR